MNNTARSVMFSVAVLVSPLAAIAAPAVAPGGKPGAVASWVANGPSITLTPAQGFDAAELAAAISAGVKGVTAKVDNGKVVVTGLAEAQLLGALEKVDVKEASGDDVDAMLAALQKPGGDDDGSGSSVRATKAADFSEVMGAKTEVITAKVLEVTHGQFPVVAVTIKVQQLPKGLVLPGVKTGAKLKVVPRVKSKGGMVDPTDEASKLNVGAWYTQPGDVVLVRLEKDPKDGVWIAAAFNRRTK